MKPKLTARALAAATVRGGKEQGKTVSGAESCTGGLIAKLLTDIPGSSSVFCGACVTYTNEVKQNLLGVDGTIIEEHTEVSHACAAAMAEGARRVFQTDVAYATTGYAGPGGGSEADPVGTVYVAISTADKCPTYRIQFPNASRIAVREGTARFVLERISEMFSV